MRRAFVAVCPLQAHFLHSSVRWPQWVALSLKENSLFHRPRQLLHTFSTPPCWSGWVGKKPSWILFINVMMILSVLHVPHHNSSCFFFFLQIDIWRDFVVMMITKMKKTDEWIMILTPTLQPVLKIIIPLIPLCQFCQSSHRHTNIFALYLERIYTKLHSGGYPKVLSDIHIPLHFISLMYTHITVHILMHIQKREVI